MVMINKARVHKVIAWRVVSFVTAGITASMFIEDRALSWGLTAILNVQMTVIHYWFESVWDWRGKD